MESVQHLLGNAGFRAAVWLCPFAFVVHVLEELPRFTPWAQRHINPHFTRRHYLDVHVSGIVGGFLAAALVSFFPARPLVFLYFTLLATPGFLCNTFFHAGASVVYRSYSPGVVSALLIYLPLYTLLSSLALGEGFISIRWWLLSTSIAVVVHALEVRHNVFRFRPSA